MAEIIMVRHGQAQTGAKDEASYDKLSDLGHQQAAWLGEYWADKGAVDRVLSGTMRRQIETGQSIGLHGVSYHQDARLNEMDYFGLAAFLKEHGGVPVPSSQEEFQTHVRDVLGAWSRAEVGDELESYADFRGRILDCVREVAARDDRTVIVSSTGVIATLIAVALDLDMARKTDVFLKIAHTSVHRFEIVGDDVRLIQFCATPHLDAPERVSLRTHI
ncbi:histidine phosphatase family protein [Amylibacter sp. IMCC11727]|uniref:histidine phosphatase family protein n=1 Tax=Amylibacter sp. IMCC11727 TaxID=3039851 RepID=UPI00244DCA6E|nr:histidine phosphatase family protein [Amylibacter sp. IMCC11727]WGI22949.1 histidine phosphatase family protein [Amylibacter sp. IMCC11727]